MTNVPSEKLAALREYVKELYTGKPYHTHHYDHLVRVCRHCLAIGTEMQADLVVLEAAALLHDIGHTNERAECHAVASARMARGVLSEHGWLQAQIEPVTYAIRVHRYSNDIVPVTLEARILQDADRLDALGAIGISRVLMHDPTQPLYLLENPTNPFSGNCICAHFYDKILYLADKMHTPEAREIATTRAAFVKTFLEQLAKDARGGLNNSQNQEVEPSGF